MIAAAVQEDERRLVAVAPVDVVEAESLREERARGRPGRALDHPRISIASRCTPQAPTSRGVLPESVSREHAARRRSEARESVAGKDAARRRTRRREAIAGKDAARR